MNDPSLTFPAYILTPIYEHRLQFLDLPHPPQPRHTHKKKAQEGLYCLHVTPCYLMSKRDIQSRYAKLLLPYLEYVLCKDQSKECIEEVRQKSTDRETLKKNTDHVC